MLKNILFFCTILFLFAACDNKKSKKPVTPVKPLTEAESDEKAGYSAAAKTGGLQEQDYAGRAKRGLTNLMTQLTEAAEVIEGFENPSFTIDEQCNVVYAYQENEAKYEKRFNIADLAHAGGKMSLQADDGREIMFPGFKIQTGTGEPLIEIYKDGKFLQNNDEWDLVLKDRAAVEKAVPNMVNVINVCRKLKKATSAE